MTGGDIKQRLVAILAADAAGYSRLMAADERATVAALDAARAAFRQRIEANRGRVIDMAGDSVLAVFETAAGAVAAALAAQRDLDAASRDRPAEQQMRFRVGVHLGDVLEKGDGSVYGDGVNIAARLQSLAESGGITVSDAVRGAVQGKVKASFVDQGEQQVKNIPHPVRAFALREDDRAGAPAVAGPRAARPLGDLPALAVLPFDSMSGDPDQEHFADGMVEEIITALARTRMFLVIARNSSFVYKGRAVDIKQVGRELGVAYVVEGSVRRSGNRLRITGQLIETEHGHHVWADRFDGTLDDVFELQDRMARSIVSAIEPSMRRAEVERVRSKPTASLQAYEFLFRALPGLMPGSTQAEMDEALGFIRRALEIDPGYTAAKAFGAFACMRRIVEGYGDADDVKVGLRYASEALAERSDDPIALSYSAAALATLGYRAMGIRVMGFRYDEAEDATRRALALNPDLFIVQVCAGTVRLALCDGDAALEHFERAMRISPLDPAAGALIASVSASHLLAGRYEEALASAQRALQQSPNYLMGLRLKLMALGFIGRLDEARVVARRVLELAPQVTVARYRSLSPLKDPQLRRRMAGIYLAAGIPKR